MTTWLQAAALAALILPLAATAANASTITCAYGGGITPCGVTGGGGGVSSGTGIGSTAFFNFDGDNNGTLDYRAELAFDDVNGPFSVSITDTITSQAALGPRFATSFPDAVCVPIFDGVNGCVEFHIVAPAPGPTTWTSAGPRGNPATIGFNFTISWFVNTDQPGDATHIRVLHDTGGTDSQYDIDITTPGSYVGPQTAGCGSICLLTDGDDDPGIGSRDNNFQNFTVVRTPTAVPEPASLLLIGSGVSALIYRKRRQRI